MEKQTDKQILKTLDTIKDYMLANVQILKRMFQEIREIKYIIMRAEKDGDKTHT